MKTSFRTEVNMDSRQGHFNFGQEYWLGLNYRYEDWAKDTSAEFGPLQIHETPGSWAPECNKGAAYNVAPFFMLSQNDEVRFVTYGGKIRWRAPIQKQQWFNISVHFRISKGTDGFVEAWNNGVKLFRIDGINSRQTDLCGLTTKNPYFKMGVYKWDWKVGLPATQSTRRQLLIDDLKIATGTNGYSLVSSASTTTSSSTPATTSSVAQADTTAATISNVQVAQTDTTATITWDTNEASDSSVNYGLSSSYGLNANNGLLTTRHSVTLENLVVDNLYHYRVSSKDSSGNTVSSADLTFTTNSPVAENLVGYWPMNAGTGTTILDMSGNGHAGKLTNGALLTTAGGVKFDGVDDYLDVGKLDVAGDAMTITAWFLADDLSNCSAQDCRIISKATGIEEADHYFMVSTIKKGIDNESETRLRFRLKTDNTTTTLIAASGNVLNNEWVHVAAVYDGATMRLYQDGVKVGSIAKQGSITTNSGSSVWIGGNPPDARSRPWKGQIDNVSIYNYALTDVEIAGLAR